MGHAVHVGSEGLGGVDLGLVGRRGYMNGCCIGSRPGFFGGRGSFSRRWSLAGSGFRIWGALIRPFGRSFFGRRPFRGAGGRRI